LQALTATMLRRYMLVFKASPFDVLHCLDLNPFEVELMRKFEQRCRMQHKHPWKTLENLVRFYLDEG